MLRNKLISNIDKLNDTEKYILSYVTNVDISMFSDKSVCDNIVMDILKNGFSDYLRSEIDTIHPIDAIHPFVKVWYKVIDDCYMEKLIEHTDMYGNAYERLANKVNELYGTEMRQTINIILKSFLERDWDELSNKFWEYWDGFECDPKIVKEDIERYSDIVANNLDESDLKTILLFCGQNIDNLE